MLRQLLVVTLPQLAVQAGTLTVAIDVATAPCCYAKSSPLIPKSLKQLTM